MGENANRMPIWQLFPIKITLRLTDLLDYRLLARRVEGGNGARYHLLMACSSEKAI